MKIADEIEFGIEQVYPGNQPTLTPGPNYGPGFFCVMTPKPAG